MIYLNDESDKALRKRNYYLTVYVMPVAFVAIIGVLIYWASNNDYLLDKDISYGYFMSLTPAFFIYAFNKRNWLKMPDGSFYNTKTFAPTAKFFNEPSSYLAEYFYSKKEKATTALTGLFLIGLSIWLGIMGTKSILIPIVTNITGLFLTVDGLKGFLDKSAILKIAKNGLWTKNLGFVKWDNINFAEVVEDKNGKSQKLFLLVRLKGTKFEEANQPDERLLLSELKDKEMIEFVINTSITDYNNQKK